MRGGRARRRLAMLVLCTALLSGCTDDGAVDGRSVDTRAASPAPAAGTEAAQLRFRLERQFSTFLHLATEAAVTRQAQRRSAAGAVDETTRALATTVAAAYDEAAGEHFRAQLENWASLYSDYAAADDDERRRARRDLLRTAGDVAAFMATVTEGGMEPEGTAALLRAPIRSSAAAVDAHREEKFERAYVHRRSAHGDIVSVGQAFAAGISEHRPEEFSGPRSSGPIELQSALQQLLVEHVLLLTAVTRRGAAGGPDFDAAAAALNGNSEDLVTALDTVYGSAVSRFAGAWRERISAIADYTVAAAQQRDARRDEAAAAIRRADAQVGRVLDEVSDGAIAGDDTTAQLRRVTAAVLDQVDRHVAREHRQANNAAAEAVEAASDLAGELAQAIVADRPDEFASR